MTDHQRPHLDHITISNIVKNIKIGQLQKCHTVLFDAIRKIGHLKKSWYT